MSDEFNLAAALNAAPSLYQSPSLAYGASQDPTDPAGAAQTVGAATEYNAASEAIKSVKKSGGGFLSDLSKIGGDIVGAVGEIPGAKDAISTAASWLNKPEAFIQHEYRYGHDVAARHGWSAFYTGKFFVDTPSSGAYKDSWARTADGANYNDPNNGQKVSFGRDVTSFIPWLDDPNSTQHSIASGLLDATFDIATDPTLKVGAAAKGAKVLDLTKDSTIAATAADDLSRVQQLRVQMAKTITLKDASSWDIAMQNSRVRMAVDKIASTSSASDLRKILPKATDSEIYQLGKASTPDAVRQVYLNGLQTSNILNKAPVVSLLSPVVDKAKSLLPSGTGSTELGQKIADGAPTDELAQSTKRAELLKRRFATRLPLDLDPTNANPTKSFHLDGPNAGDIVHGIVSYSFDKNVANAVRDAYVATPDLTKKAVILGNAIKAAGWNMGFKDLDPQYWKAWSQDLESNISRGKAYGIDGETGNVLDGAISTPDRAGSAGSTAAALFSSQTGRAAIPHFNDLRKAIADAQSFTAADGAVKKTWGVLNPLADSGATFKADDFLYNKLTQPVFKRLALFSGGFALRIGLGEGLYKGLDDGAVPFLRSQIASRAAKMQYKLDSADHKNYLASAIVSGLHKMNPDEAAVGVRLQMEGDGHLLPHELDANHIAPDTIESQTSTYAHNYKKIAAQSTPSGLSDVFRTYDEDHQYFDFFYRKHLEDIASAPEGRALASTYLKHLSDPAVADADVATIGDHAKMLQSKGGRAATRNMDRSTDYALQNNGGYTGFAGSQLNALKGAITGSNGVPNLDTLKAIAEGNAPTLKDLEGMARDAKPKVVPGQEVSANTDSSIARVFNAGHRKVISPVINGLSRNGSYIRGVTAHYKQTLAQGLPDQDAFRIAQQRAAHDLAPMLHNPNIRTQFSELARNFMPFYFAQDQAYRRWGALAARSPESLRKLQLIHQAGVNTGFVHKDPTTGQETFVYPMSGYIGTGVKDGLDHLGIHSLDAVPLSFSGNVSSLSTVTPFAQTPGLQLGGPAVGVPLAALESYAPESAPLVEAVKGPKGSGQGVWDMLLPNAALKDVVLAYAGDHSAAFQSAQMQAMQTVFYDKLNSMDANQRASFLADPLAQQKLIDQSKSFARTMFLMKAVIGEGLPTQPSMNIGNTGLKAEVAQLMRTEPTVGDALQKFQANHPGKDLSPYSVFQSQSVAGGYIPPTQEALDYFEQNKDLISKLPYGAAWLIPQKGQGADALKVYNEQIAAGLREKRSPEDFLTQLYVAAGNQQYYTLRDQKNEALAAYGDQSAIKSLNQEGIPVPAMQGDDPVMRQQINNQWTQVTSSLSQQNPVWASQQGNSVKAVARQRALQDFSVLFDPKNADKVPQDRQYQLVGQLYQQYLAYSAQRSQIVQQPGTTSDQTTALDEQWQSYLAGLAKSTPELGPVIQSVFKEVK